MALFKKTRAKPQPKQGKLIVIDGTDGSGKATQTKLLIEALEVAGYRPEVMEFPQYDTKSAGPLEKYLNGKYGTEVNPYAASTFYAVDRFDASFRIRKHLEAGKIVVADRYVTSNAGHQGSKIANRVERIKFFKWLDHFEYTIFGIPKPDLNIILHVPAIVSFGLINDRNSNTGRQGDILENDLEHLKQAEQVYLEIAKLFPNTKLVECIQRGKLLPRQQIHNKVWELVRRIALKNLTPQ